MEKNPTESEPNKNQFFDQKGFSYFGIILISALIFGLGWRLRGSGTSDPSVVLLLFLLFIAMIHPPKKKFNYLMFGFIVLIFRILRRGWGTFVSQAGIPWVYPGTLSSTTEGYNVIVSWWQGYFWLFLVGLAWSGLAAHILGGYFFADKKYQIKDILYIGILYIVGLIIGIFIALEAIPYISPDAYHLVYETGISARNYNSMRDNFALSFAMILPLIYIWLVKKDRSFTKRTLVVMIIFGIAFSVADLWQVLGRNIPGLGLPFWSMWEYFSGFIIGGLLCIFYHEISKEKKPNLNIISYKFKEESTGYKILLYILGHVALFLFGIQASITGMINSISTALGSNFTLQSWIIIVIILAIDIPLYYLHIRGKIFRKFSSLEFNQRARILFIGLLPFYFLCYAVQYIVSGTLFTLQISNLVVWMTTISFIIIEIWAILIYNKLKRLELNTNKI